MHQRPIFRTAPRGQELNRLRLLSLIDGLLLAALLWAAITERHEAVEVLGPVHGVLFLILIAGLALAARRGWLSWRFVGLVVVLGPLASVPGLERYRRRFE